MMRQYDRDHCINKSGANLNGTTCNNDLSVRSGSISGGSSTCASKFDTRCSQGNATGVGPIDFSNLSWRL